jgi:hypothetical protein
VPFTGSAALKGRQTWEYSSQRRYKVVVYKEVQKALSEYYYIGVLIEYSLLLVVFQTNYLSNKCDSKANANLYLCLEYKVRNKDRRIKEN